MKLNTKYQKVIINQKEVEIPAEWTKKPIKDFFEIKVGDLILEKDLIENGTIPVYSATKDDRLYGYVNEAKTNLRKDIDMVLPARGGSIGNAKIPTEDSTSTQSTLMLISITKSKNLSRYVKNYFKAYKKDLFRDTAGGAILQLKRKDLENLEIPVPKTEEEMGNISDLIERQIEIIELRKKQLEQEEQKLKVLETNLLRGKIRC